ncbi:MAG: efflux RND transporter periplasmic adaptor subunit, partial [Terracidiphilus sp.]
MARLSKDRNPARCGGLALLAMGIAATGCHGNGPGAVPQAVRVDVVQEVRPDTAERYSASFLPWTQVDLAFKSPGLVESILQVRGADGRMRDAEAGDKVAKGAKLAVVRQLDYTQRLEQAEQQAKQAEAQLAAAEAVFRDAELDYTRAVNLYKTASLTKPDFDQAKARYESTQQQADAAKAVVQAARTAVSQAQLGVSDTTIRAPFTGWITARNVSVGSLVSGATVAFSMVETSTVKAMFAVPDTSLRSIHAGQQLTVTLDAIAEPVNGTVTALSPEADPKSRVFTIEVSVPNASDEVRPGMIGSIAIGGQKDSRPRLMVPLSAVVRLPESSTAFAVFLVEQRNGASYAAAREITVGQTYGNSVEVTSGL